MRRHSPVRSPFSVRSDINVAYRIGRCPLALFFVVALHLTSQAAPESRVVDDFISQGLTDEYYSEGCAAADLNADGHVDIVYGPYWFEGPGFSTKHVIYPPVPQPRDGYTDHFFAWVYDFNGDKLPDVLTAGFPGTPAYVYINPGHWETDEPWVQHAVLDAVCNESPQFVNIVGDERPELVCTHDGYYGYATIDPENPLSPWAFHAVSDHTAPVPFGHGLGVGDVNGDGRSDILCSDGWYEQPAKSDSDAANAAGGGRWRKHDHSFTDSYGGAEIYAYDVDGDGDADIVTSLAAHDFGLAWFEQKQVEGESRFERHLIMGSRPEENPYGVLFSELHAVRLEDMDGDGLKDIVTGKTYFSHHRQSPQWDAGAVVYWFRLTRDQGVVDWKPYLVDGDAGIGRQITIADVDGNQSLDIVVGGMKGAHYLRHVRGEVSEVDWAKRQPPPIASAEGSGPGSIATPLVAGETLEPGTRARGEDGHLLNLGFESGTTEDWVATGEAFTQQPIRGDTVHLRRDDMVSGHDGDYWIGGYERLLDPPTGSLTSADFEVTQPYGSFLIGGGGNAETRMELVRADTKEVIYQQTGGFSEAMKRVVVDLHEHQGKKIHVHLIDTQTEGWGHLNFDDFRLHATAPAPPTPSHLPTKQTVAIGGGFDPAEALRKMRLPPGFTVTLCASEPEIKQPIAMALDDRGRLWVAEAYEYPRRAPEGQGRDRILIFTDQDGDGKFEERKVFAEGLNLVSGLEVGFGGVWVGAAPYLLFIPDANGDDQPDSAPQVLLDGWGYEDTHETLNAFIWGPDGWLYGCHGVFTHSRVGKPGSKDADRIPLNAAIWRYHPTRHVFEVFAQGTSNPWGVDFNDFGQAFCTACVIPHLYHIIPGARYQRQAGEHFNPHNYDDIKTIADHSHFIGNDPWAAIGKSDDQGGGHAHAGAMIYLGNAWPEEYRNQIFMNNIHGQRLNMDHLTPRGSGYVGSHGPDFLLTDDAASQMINLRYGPDGQVYVIDWYDMQACHTDDVEKPDRSNGRIYKVSFSGERAKLVDLRAESDGALAQRVLDRNDWYVRHARRILQERSAAGKLDASIANSLREIATKHADPTRRLRAAWALSVTDLLDGATRTAMRHDDHEQVRSWGIRLEIQAQPHPADATLLELATMARKDLSPVVRLSLASELQRMPMDQRWEILNGLISHPEDANDHNLPLMIWYAAEPLVESAPERALQWGLEAGKSIPRLRDFAARRIGDIGSPQSLDLLVQGLRTAREPAVRASFVQALQHVVQGRRSVAAPSNWKQVAQPLMAEGDEALRLDLLTLGVVFGDVESIQQMRALAKSGKAAIGTRQAAIKALMDAGDSEALGALLESLLQADFRELALRGLAQYDDPRIPAEILAHYSEFAPAEKRAALVTLCGRSSYAQKMLAAMQGQQIASSDLSADLISQLVNLRDATVSEALTTVWGRVRESEADKKEWIARYKALATDSRQPAVDIMLGRALFARTCQKCHILFGLGAKIGPDLTGSNRADLEYLLSNVVDPSSVLAKEYQQTVVTTESGRVLTGIVQGDDGKSLSLRTVDTLKIVPLDEIEERVAIEKSMMPDDQLKPLTEHEVRSLIAYLRSPTQTPILALPEAELVLFNGVDLSGWRGDPALWSVENGEIVGRSTGLEKNAFLISDWAVEDFTLSVEVWLKGNVGNSGIQFRSEVLPDGDLRGYQADIGPGWWGKLYEEHGRELLASSADESAVHPDGWNTYRIVTQGNHVETYLNDQKCVSITDPEGARRGIFALQIHSGDATEIRFRNLKLEMPGK